MRTDSPLLLTNIHVFDAAEGRFKAPADMFMSGGLISAVGRLDGLDTTQALVADCTGKYAVPGLWECHAHLATYTAQNTELRRKIQFELAPSADLSWEEFVQMQLRRFTELGILYIRDVGGPVRALEQLRDHAASCPDPCPEIFYAGPMLEKSPPAWLDEENFPGFTVGIDTRDDADAMIRLLKTHDARLMKTFNRFDADIYEYLIGLAADCGLPVTHDPGTPLFNHMPMDRAVDLGIRCFEHAKAPLPVVLREPFKSAHDRMIHMPGDDPDKQRLVMEIFQAGVDAMDTGRLDAFMDKMLERGVYLCPTLHTLESIITEDTSDPGDEKTARKRMISRGFVDISQWLTREMSRRGVRILAGHDGCRAENLLTEMELLQACGVAPADVIRGATLYPAQWLDMDHVTGTLEPGKTADLVLLDKNPLDNISHIRSVSGVIQNGCLIDRRGDDHE